MTPLLLLAATEATQPTVSEYGVTLLALAFITRWLWDYNRAKREEANQHEPKATPPLHHQFATREEHKALASRVDDLSGEIRDGFQKLDEKRSRSTGGLHQRIEESNQTIRSEIKTDIKGVHDRLTTLVGAVSELKGGQAK
ncbi:MAG TPA: hypothetical protein VGD88_06120 [Opitutaceae bacterium]